MHDVFNKLYATFARLADDPQEPIDLKPLPNLLRNEIEMISHKRYFNQRQLDIIVTCAINEAKLLLLLPPVKAMPLEELERAWRVRGVVLTVWDDPLFQKQIAELLPPVIPSQRKLYEAIVYLNRELRFAQGCSDEIIKRIRSEPITLATHGLVEMWQEEMMQLDPQFAKEVRTISFEYLRSELLRGRIIPDKSEKESLINDALGKRCAELREMPYYKRISEFGNTVIAVRQDMKDWLKKQRRQKRYPKGGFVSLDAEVEKADGSKTTRLDILTQKYGSLQTQPLEMNEHFTQEQQQQLEQLLGKKGLKILEYRLKHPEIIGIEGEKKEIAQALEIAESTVGRYIGTKNHIGIFEKNAEEIKKIYLIAF